MGSDRVGAEVIWNVIDRRKRPYKWKVINAVIEATWQDNACQDADEARRPDDEGYVMYDQRVAVSLHEAVTWANSQSCPVTLYLYDQGAGIS
jgi:hypothetical protein